MSDKGKNNPDILIDRTSAGGNVNIGIRQKIINVSLGMLPVLLCGGIFLIAIACFFFMNRSNGKKDETEKQIAERRAAALNSGRELFELVVKTEGDVPLQYVGEVNLLEAVDYAGKFARGADINIFTQKASKSANYFSATGIGSIAWLGNHHKASLHTVDLSALFRGRPDPLATTLAGRNLDDWVNLPNGRLTVALTADGEYFSQGKAQTATQRAMGMTWWEAYAISMWMGGRLATEREVRIIIGLDRFRDDSLSQLWLCGEDTPFAPVADAVPGLRYEQGVIEAVRFSAWNEFSNARFAVFFSQH